LPTADGDRSVTSQPRDPNQTHRARTTDSPFVHRIWTHTSSTITPGTSDRLARSEAFALVEELTTVYWSRWAAFSGPDANPDQGQHWHTYFLPPFYARMAQWCGGPQNLNKCQSGHHVAARRQEGRDGAPARWAAMTAQLRETDEDDRPVESIGHAQDSAEHYPALTVVPPQPDPPPPDHRGPTSTTLT
jgi:hypothetical protein